MVGVSTGEGKPMTARIVQVLSGQRGNVSAPAAGSPDATLADLSAPIPEPVLLLGHSGYISAVAYSPDGRLLASSCGDRIIRLWDTRTRRLIRNFVGHSDKVENVVFTPDGQSLISCGFDRTLRIWDVASGRVRRVLAGHATTVYGLSIAEEGNLVASASESGHVILWDWREGVKVREYFEGRSSLCCALSADGRLLATLAENRRVHLWDTVTGIMVLIIWFFRPFGETQ